MVKKISIKTLEHKKLLEFITSKPVYHTVFWLGVLAMYSLVEIIFTRQGLLYTFSNNLVRMVILGVAVYYNLYRLIPGYLAKKKFLPYLSSLLLVVFIVSPIEGFIIYLKSHNNPEMQDKILSSLNWSFLPNLFILATSTVVKITLDWYKNMRERQELETRTMQTELRFLKSQINPHFLFNTLNSLYAHTLKKSDQAPEIVLRLAEMMRYMLYDCNEKWVELGKEVNYISNYLELERLRQGKNADIRFEVQGNVSQQKIAPLMFIPFIENCFKHGLGNNISQGFVHILLTAKEGEIDLHIENSKPERLPDPLAGRSGGIGLVNVRRRLELLYPGRYDLKIEDKPGIYQVRLNLLLPDSTVQEAIFLEQPSANRRELHQQLERG
ncbi:MAG: hypothetical protein RI973_1876 [Bacteroidota bacterium]|jgi:sensor histidine kinase YesM